MKTRILFSAVLAAATATLLVSQAPVFADDSSDQRWWPQDRIEGVWLAKVSLTNCATGETLPFPAAEFDAMAVFASNGTLHNTDENNPATRSANFGTWERTGRNTYRFAFRLFRFDTTGLLIGSQIVRHKLVLSRDGLRYTSSGGAEFYDVNGIRMLPDGCSRTTAARFK